METSILQVLRCLTLLSIMTENTRGQEGNSENSMRTVDNFFKSILPNDYDVAEPPSQAEVNITFSFMSIPSVEFSSMEIEVEFLFIAMWHDDRLILNKSTEAFRNAHSLIQMPDKFLKHFWVPYTMFPECKRCKLGFATGGESKPMSFKSETGDMTTIFRDTMAFSCQFDLSFYPFDAHECRVALQLMGDAISMPKKLNDYYILQHPRDEMIRSGMPSEFYFDEVIVKQACTERNYGMANSKQCLQFIIRFHRIPYSYLMLTYTPTITIVIISWISFWIPVDIVAPRVTLGLTSLLTLTTQFSNAQKDLPPVAYVKALDVWMLTCVVMVFGSLMEFALSYTGKLQKKPVVNPVIKVNEPKILPVASSPNEVKPSLSVRKPGVGQKKEANSLDAKAKIIFPVVFVLFNIIYWPYYGRTG